MLIFLAHITSSLTSNCCLITYQIEIDFISHNTEFQFKSRLKLKNVLDFKMPRVTDTVQFALPLMNSYSGNYSSVTFNLGNQFLHFHTFPISKRENVESNIHKIIPRVLLQLPGVLLVIEYLNPSHIRNTRNNLRFLYAKMWIE